MPTKQQLDCLRWTGFLGHTFIVIKPSPRAEEKGKWRTSTESSCLAHALIGLEPGQVIFQKISTRVKGGAWRESYRDVTPKPAAPKEVTMGDLNRRLGNFFGSL